MSKVLLEGQPADVVIQTASGWKTLNRGAEGTWSAPGLSLAIRNLDSGYSVELEAPGEPVSILKIRWKRTAAGQWRILGDHWERAYGDMEWRGIVPERAMPWYFLVYDGERTAGCGIRTAPSAFVCWQLDADGITFTADVTSGNRGVRLGERKLKVAEIIQDSGREAESPFMAARRFCALLCERPVLPKQPVYGGNNWYYAYGNSSRDEMLEDSRFISSLSSHSSNRPYMVIDDGWQFASSGGGCKGGPWVGNSRFSDMERLAGDMKEIGVKPGIWFRPLLVSENLPERMIRYSNGNDHVLDPSVPESLDYIRQATKQMAGWGFELLKHDFTTYDLTGKWGFAMRAKPHGLEYGFHDDTRTTAEITLDLYRVLAEASGGAALLGCNTLSHLAAGLFEIQRSGDDTSGKWWERTRYMGINTLAFRMAQHATFYSHDADCVGITADVPWELNRQWLQLLAASGTPLFVSADPKLVTAEQQAELRKAFELAAVEHAPAEPLDWMGNTCPSLWKVQGEEKRFVWNQVSASLLGATDNGWWLE